MQINAEIRGVLRTAAKGLRQLATAVKTLAKSATQLADLPPDSEIPVQVQDQAELFKCDLCSYQTGNKTDWKRHVKRQKHLSRVEASEQPGEDKRLLVLHNQLKKKYPDIEKNPDDYQDVDYLCALAYLQKTHRRTGKQAMYVMPLRVLFETVHKFIYKDQFYMRAGRNQILSKSLSRFEYTFKVFDQFYSSCREVIQFANEIIKDRGKCDRYEHNRRNWECYLYCVENGNLPKYLKDKTPKQKDYDCISLHEYFQTCG